jgi:hypothetical protein
VISFQAVIDEIRAVRAFLVAIEARRLINQTWLIIASLTSKKTSKPDPV